MVMARNIDGVVFNMNPDTGHGDKTNIHKFPWNPKQTIFGKARIFAVIKRVDLPRTNYYRE
jgi:hypothetical protein